MWTLETITSGLAAIRSYRRNKPNDYCDETNIFRDTSCHRGCPMGGMGTGGFGIGTDGGFLDFRINHNWMNPVAHAKGSFLAIETTAATGETCRRILRRSYSGGKEYKNIENIQHTRFQGRPASFELIFEDSALPLQVIFRGFSPLIPGDEDNSTLPAALFQIEVHNRSQEQYSYRLLFSMENLVGCGGTGQTGVHLWHHWISGTVGRRTYQNRSQCIQEALEDDHFVGLHFRNERQVDSASHEKSVMGSHYLIAPHLENPRVETILCWDAASEKPSVLETFAGSEETKQSGKTGGRIALPGHIRARAKRSALCAVPLVDAASCG